MDVNTSIFRSAHGCGSQTREVLAKEGEGLGKFGYGGDGRRLGVVIPREDLHTFVALPHVGEDVGKSEKESFQGFVRGGGGNCNTKLKAHFIMSAAICSRRSGVPGGVILQG